MTINTHKQICRTATGAAGGTLALLSCLTVMLVACDSNQDALSPPRTSATSSRPDPKTLATPDQSPIAKPTRTRDPSTAKGPNEEQPSTTKPAPTASRLGCGTYCRNAGGYGAPENAHQPAVTFVVSGTVVPDADGYIPVTLTCNLPALCEGALSADSRPLGDDSSSSRSDLLVDAGTTRTIGVPLSAAALEYLKSHGPVTLSVTADNGLVPPCEDIPQLAAGCAEFTAAPDYEFADGDGITRLVVANLSVSAGS